MTDDTLKPAVFEGAEGTDGAAFVQPGLDDGNAQPAAVIPWDQQPKPAQPVRPLLRTDGPTLAQYVAAGYDAATYPPPGYAAVADTGAAEVVQPTADLARHVPQPMRASIADNADELSIAAKHAMAPMHVAPPEVRLPPGRFKLAYEYNGQKILERHRTVPHALASIRRLKMMGIVPATSTDPAPASAAA